MYRSKITRGRLMIMAVALSAVLITSLAAAETITFPQTRAGEIARAYFDAFNSGDEQKIRAFEEKYRSAGALEKRPIDERIPRLLALREQVGDLEPAAIIDEKPNSIAVTAHATKPDMWVSCTFSLEAEEPHKLVSVAIMPGSAPDAAQAYVTEWKNLADLLDQIRAKTGVPAVAAAIVQKGTITDIAVVGERWVGSGQAAELGDSWHIGSITKSMTATMIAALVQKELLAWDFTVADILVGMEMRDEYRDVTLEQILQHRGGFPGYTNIDDDEHNRLRDLPGDATRKREAFVQQILMEKPQATPGTSMNYSNAGYVVAALMAERVSSRGWEELVQLYVFQPANMKTAGFGWPATPDNPDQPRGHYKEGDDLRPQIFGEYELGAFLAPAGDVHCSIEDLARYATLHLRGLAGRDKDFDAETIQRLHTPPGKSTGEMAYAAGWAIVDSPDVGEVHVHSGSAGTFLATIELYPQYNMAVVFATNGGLKIGTAASREITDLVKQRIKEESNGR
jgi:CubicO group peptidase (beta-lactamase class C family)